MNAAEWLDKCTSGFEQALASVDLARVLTERREELAARADGLGALEAMGAYADITDALVGRVYDIAIECDEALSPPARRTVARGICVAAVGGYGRREMSPFSDVDVAFIVRHEEDEAVDAVVKRAFRILMDVLEMAGLKVGYSYRRVDDVENLPLDTQTAMLDARCVAGSQSLFSALRVALGKGVVPARFVVGHTDARTNGGGPSRRTPFVVEPDIKEGPGGLRDLHTARWVSQVTFGLPGEGVWEGLRSMGILLDGEIERTTAAAEFVSRTRNTLHLLAGRGLDVLSASRHVEVAQKLGFEKPEEFISAYYAAADQLWKLCRKVSKACLQADLQIELGVVARDGRLCILDRCLLGRDGAALLRVFQHAQSYHLEISRESADMVAAVAPEYRLTLEAKQTLVDILSSFGAAAALRSMAEVGVLQAVVPQFGDLMYLVPGDAAHQFTVGEHSLRAVEQIEALLLEPNDQFADIFSRVQHYEVLFLATLLHDIGKLDSLRDHAKTGAFRAAKHAADLGMPEDACAKVEFLVRNHLKMAETARLRDLHQPRTIRDFVAVVKDQQLLDMLFLLTVADYRAVGSTNWSQVQVRFLLELHERASAALRRPGAATPDIARHRSRVRRELCLASLPAEEVNEHCESMPASYLLNTPPEELAAHIGWVSVAKQGTPTVELKDDRAGEFTLLTVVAMDRPGLLSEIAGVLHALSIDIHAAQIFTRHAATEIAIDTLYIDFEGRQLTEVRKWQLEGDLLSVLTGSVSLDSLLGRWGKGAFRPLSELTIQALDNLSDHETVLEVRTTDTPGLLYYLTRKIAEQGFSIHSARIATWGHEARDVFYVTGPAGYKLNARQLERLHRAMSG